MQDSAVLCARGCILEERTAAVAAFTRAVSNLEFCQTADSLTTTGFNLYISSSNRAVAKTGSCAAIILYNCTNCWGRQCAGKDFYLVGAENRPFHSVVFLSDAYIKDLLAKKHLFVFCVSCLSLCQFAKSQAPVLIRSLR